MNRSEIKQAAATISRILGKVRDRTLDASGPVGNALVRRLEGAQLALESIVRPRAKATRKASAKSR